MMISSLKNGAENTANCSGQSLAMLLGEISPKISTAIVIIIVEYVAPASPPHSFTKNTVPSDASEIFTILFPTKTVDISLS